MIIAICGPIASGKTTLAYGLRKYFADRMLFEIIEDDTERRAYFGYSLAYKMTPADYAPEIDAVIQQKMREKTIEQVKNSTSIINASGFFTQESQQDIETFAKDLNTPFLGLRLVVTLPMIKERLTRRMVEREQNPHNLSLEKGHASDACFGVLDKYPPGVLYSSEKWEPIDANQKADQVLKLAIHAIEDFLRN